MAAIAPRIGVETGASSKYSRWVLPHLRARSSVG